MIYKRVFLVVLDGAGVGRAPDAAEYGDLGSDTIGNVARALAAKGAPLALPNLAALGLGALYDAGLPGVPALASAAALHGRLSEVSAGKDTTTGHWELMGIIRDEPAPLFPDGFPDDLVKRLSDACNAEWIGNRAASGTQIIQELGEEHLRTGKLILYTSADSVLQIAAHEQLVPLRRLYEICESARQVLIGPYAVNRVIARPFTGIAGVGFSRTPDRKDFSVPPPGSTVLDELEASGMDVIGVGKISDIFAGRGLTKSIPVHGNEEQMSQVGLFAAPASDWRGLCFANLVDFDMLFGHRNDVEGFGEALVGFDRWLGVFRAQMLETDLLIITADHGNDPTTHSTDHSREQVPLLITSNSISMAGGSGIEPAPGLVHVGATVCAALGVASKLPGQSCV